MTRCRIVMVCWSIVASIVTAVSAVVPTLLLENGIRLNRAEHSSSETSSADQFSDSSSSENKIFSATYTTRGRRKTMEDFHLLSQDNCFAGTVNIN